jgi:hypothetical protein
VIVELLNPDVTDKLKNYGIREGEYRLQMGRYHTEDRKGVPYRMLIIKKRLPPEQQTRLEWELQSIDESLSVIFKH